MDRRSAPSGGCAVGTSASRRSARRRVCGDCRCGCPDRDCLGQAAIAKTNGGGCRRYGIAYCRPDCRRTQHPVRDLPHHHRCRAPDFPPAALVGLRDDGTPDVLAVSRSLVRRPSQLPALARIAVDAWIARQALRRGRSLLGAGLGCPYAAHPATEMLVEADMLDLHLHSAQP